MENLFASGCDAERERIRQAIQRWHDEGYLETYEHIRAILRGETHEEYVENILNPATTIDLETWEGEEEERPMTHEEIKDMNDDIKFHSLKEDGYFDRRNDDDN